MSMNEPKVSDGEVWKADSHLIKDKAVVVLISLLMIAFAAEAIRVALSAWITGITPQVFGLMPTRELAWGDSIGILAVALGGIAFVGFHLSRILLRGLPRRIVLVEEVGGRPEPKPTIDETACLRVEYDGLLQPTRYFFFTDIKEFDAVARGTMGGGGHQVRLRLRDQRLAQAIARFDLASEAAALASRLEADRQRILGLDADRQAE